MKGRCKLCLKDMVDLQVSHFLPAGIYRILRDVTEGNPNPWRITETTAFQTSRQVTALLLCKCCEQRLSKHGEDWVLRHCLRDDRRFYLSSILALRTPEASWATTRTRIYSASKIPKIDVFALAYFAASVFWRGSIHPWKDDGSIPVTLGPFQEEFRKYLMGESTFPKDCSLCVVVREGTKLNRLTAFPVGERKSLFHVYSFPMPGFGFSLGVGKNIPAIYREMCFVHGVGNPIIVTPFIEQFLEEGAVELYKRAVAAQVRRRVT
jgi:hypothetical protein